MLGEIQDPWLSFLREVDQGLKGPVEVHCLGGFVLGVLWGLPRPTGDIDFIELRPSQASEELLGIAGEGTTLATGHRLHFQRVGVATYPDGYESRLTDMTPRGFQNLKMRALDVHDIVLAKVSRNSPRDRSDIEFLAKKGVLARRLLQERFDTEMRPYLLNEARETLTLELWLEEFFGIENS